MSHKDLSMAVAVLVLALVACEQQSWESAMAAGQQAMQRGRYEEAERIFAVAVRKAGEQYGAHHRNVGVALSSEAQALAAQSKYVEAEPLYTQALKIYQDAHGETHADVAATLNNLGVLHRLHGQYAEAEPLLNRALAIKE